MIIDYGGTHPQPTKDESEKSSGFMKAMQINEALVATWKDHSPYTWQQLLVKFAVPDYQIFWFFFQEKSDSRFHIKSLKCKKLASNSNLKQQPPSTVSQTKQLLTTLSCDSTSALQADEH